MSPPAGERPAGRQIFTRRHVQTANHDGAPHRRGAPHVELPVSAPAPAAVPILEGLAEGDRVLVDGAEPPKSEASDSYLTEQQLNSGMISVVVAEEKDVSDAVTIGRRPPFDAPGVSD